MGWIAFGCAVFCVIMLHFNVAAKKRRIKELEEENQYLRDRHNDMYQ